MTSALLFARNSPQKHIILRHIVSTLQEAQIPLDSSMVQSPHLSTLRNSETVLIDDPLAYLIFRLLTVFSKRKNILFLSLEMFEHQLPWNSAYNFVRNSLFFFAHRWALKRADWVFFPNNLRRDHYCRILSKLAAKSSLLHNYPAPTTKAEPLSPSHLAALEAVRQFCANYRLTAIYAGSTASGRDMSLITDPFKETTDLGLILISSTKNPELKNSCAGASILYLEALPHHVVLEAYGLCQVGLLTYQNDPLNTKYCAPVKIYEYANAGLFILGNKNYSLLNNPLVHAYFETKEEFSLALAAFLSQPRPPKYSFDIRNEVLAELGSRLRPLIKK